VNFGGKGIKGARSKAYGISGALDGSDIVSGVGIKK
jgi:hypothetical protein